MSDGQALVLCSGGLDSSCLMAYLQTEEKRKVYPLFVDRGQRARKREYSALVAVSEHLGVAERIIRASYDISEAKKFAQKGKPAFQAPGFVAHPERNLVFISMAYGVGATLGMPQVYVASNKDDAGDMPDSRVDFLELVTETLRKLNPKGTVLSPFASWSKAKIIQYAMSKASFGIQFLKLTRTCWESGELHCGECRACQSRRRAFLKAEVRDPTEYVREPELPK